MLGIKLGMSQVFGPAGEVIPVTVIRAGPCAVLEVLPEKKALKLGFGEVKESRLKKPVLGYFRKLNLPPRRYIREFPFENPAEFKPGQELTVEIWKPGDIVDVTGVSKGHGFSGAIKRWGFSRWPESHGHTEQRRTGSIGASGWPGHVLKNKKMPGHFGVDRVTVLNLPVVAVRSPDHLLLVRGAVPGARNGLLLIRKSLRKIAIKIQPKPSGKKAKKPAGPAAKAPAAKPAAAKPAAAKPAAKKA